MAGLEVMDPEPLFEASSPDVNFSGFKIEPIYSVALPDSRTSDLPRNQGGKEDTSKELTTRFGIRESINTIDIEQKNITISNPLEFRNLSRIQTTKEGDLSVESDLAFHNYQAKPIDFPHPLGSSKPAFENDRRRSQEQLPPRKKSLEDYPVFSHLGFQMPVSVPPSEDVEMSMEMEEQKILDTMSQLKSKHQQIVDRKLAREAAEKRAQEERKGLLNQAADVETQIKALDVMRAKLINDRTRGAAENIVFEASKLNRERDALAQLLGLARRRIETRRAYLRLGSLFLFFLVYTSTVLVQRDTATAFGVESSFLMSSLMDTLPMHGVGGPFNGGAPGSTGLLSSNEEFYTWLGQNVVGKLFADAVCGDGRCDSPEETPAVGRFGCAADCGRADTSNVVTIDISLHTVIQERFPVDLQELDPGFKFNVFSSHYQDFVFQSLMTPSLSPISAEVVLWDNLTLYLFQTFSLVNDVNPDQIEQILLLERSTIPPPAFGASMDYFYGDPRELLSIAEWTLVQVRTYCHLNVGNSACVDSPWPFPRGFANYFHPIDTGVQLMGLYGLSGDVTVSTVDRSPNSETSGQVIKTSLVDSRLDRWQGRFAPAIGYCSALPETQYSIPYPRYADYYTSLMASIAGQCTSGTRAMDSVDEESNSRLKGANRPYNDSAVRQSGVHRRILLSSISNISMTVLQSRAASADFNTLTSLPVGNSQSMFSTTALRRTTSPFRGTTTSSTSFTSDDDENTLNVTISELGLDPKGYWRCFGGPNDVTENPACWRANGQAMLNSYGSQPIYGFQGPVYAAIDVLPPPAGLELRASISTSGTAATCSGANRAPSGAQIVSLFGVRRYVLYSMRATIFSAWLCGFPDGIARNISTLNITSELESVGLPPLEPGPFASLDLTFDQALSTAHQTVLQESLCAVVWERLDDNCAWRVFSSSGYVPAQKLWKLSFRFLMRSNSNSARASYLLAKRVNSVEFRTQFPVKDPAYFASVTTPSTKLAANSVYGCTTHYDCMPGMFCSLNAQQIWGSNYMGGGAACDLCRYCLSDYVDAIDKWCPRDKCGAKTGKYPSCINAAKLFDGFECPMTYTINLTKIPDYSVRQNRIKNSSHTLRKEGLTKARFLTPFNQLVGSLTVTQKRSNGTCVYKNDGIGAYSRTKDPAQGQICRGSNIDSRPFGYDPAFLSSSKMYDGTLDATRFYKVFERNPTSLQSVPYGFFPHQYDGQNHTNKHSDLVLEEQANNFILYFEERLTGTQAQKLISYMENGGFIDSQTDTISVEAITLNSQLNVFAKISFTFTWQTSGKIVWDYAIHSVPIYLYPDSDLISQAFLEVLCVLFLGINTLSELKDAVGSIRRFEVMEYVLSAWNLIDWAHFCIMWFGWVTWLRQIILTSNLPMKPGYPILVAPGKTTQARVLLTDSIAEHDFLLFSSHVHQLTGNMSTYTTLTSLGVILFILRLLKVLDFQPKMALITRTLSNTMADLSHFFILFTIVWMGYTIAGMMLFGHLIKDFSSLSLAATSLIIILISWDPSSSLVQMLHASSEWMYSLYLWSWILLAFFILLNIFLAILVNGYILVKQQSQESGCAGMISELVDTFKHECQKLMQFLVPSYPFISDEQLAARISSRLRATRASSIIKVHRMLEDYHRIALNNFFEITLSSGEQVTSGMMYDLLKDLSLVRPRFDTKDEDDTEKYLHAALTNLMSRYGSPVVPDHFKIRDEQNKTFMESAHLDTMKRVAELHLSSITHQLVHGGKDAATKAPICTLSVTVERARHLPHMDLGKGVDIFCALFVEGAPGLFQTEILRGKSEQDWIWEDATFDWDLGHEVCAEGQDRKLVVMVYDKDQISSDDMIGCVMVKLKELQSGPLDEWREIVRPQKQFFERKRGVEKPELKVKAALTISSDAPRDESKEANSPLGQGEGWGKALSAAVWSGSEYASSGSFVPNAAAAAYIKPL